MIESLKGFSGFTTEAVEEGLYDPCTVLTHFTMEAP